MHKEIINKKSKEEEKKTSVQCSLGLDRQKAQEELQLELNMGPGQEETEQASVGMAEGKAQKQCWGKAKARLAGMKSWGRGLMCDGSHWRGGRIKPWLKLEICPVGSGEHSGNFSVEEAWGRERGWQGDQ